MSGCEKNIQAPGVWVYFSPAFSPTSKLSIKEAGRYGRSAGSLEQLEIKRFYFGDGTYKATYQWIKCISWECELGSDTTEFIIAAGLCFDSTGVQHDTLVIR